MAAHEKFKFNTLDFSIYTVITIISSKYMDFTKG